MQQRAGLRLKEAGKGLYLREANKLMSNIEKNRDRFCSRQTKSWVKNKGCRVSIYISGKLSKVQRARNLKGDLQVELYYKSSILE